jgi:hypothetical protein
MSLIRHAIVDTNTNIVVNVIEYEEIKTETPPGLEQEHLLCVASDIAGPGFTYNNGVFTAPQPFPSWILVDNIWNPPTPHPTDDNPYIWDESIKSWKPL